MSEKLLKMLIVFSVLSFGIGIQATNPFQGPAYGKYIFLFIIFTHLQF